MADSLFLNRRAVMRNYIPLDWVARLQAECKKTYFRNLEKFVEKEYAEHVCYPKKEAIFSAFEFCSFKRIKVVIIGQDPYHGPDQANGLCFSVNDGINHPPSLRNIFREMEEDLGKPYPKSGNLQAWAKQGVLLLNATLTVRAHEAGSHQKQGWEQFTDTVISLVSEELEGVVFLLWGGYAKRKAKLIDSKKHHILSSGHPSPLSANRGFWFGNNHFSRVNSILATQKTSLIRW